MLDAVKLAMDRSASLAHDEMKRGLSTLAFIQSVAPTLGLIGLLERIYDSLGGMRSESTPLMAVIMGGASEGFAVFALGLFAALAATLSRAYLLNEVRTFSAEIESASVQLVGELASTNI